MLQVSISDTMAGRSEMPELRRGRSLVYKTSLALRMQALSQTDIPDSGDGFSQNKNTA
jgi:hypothetical protein